MQSVAVAVAVAFPESQPELESDPGSFPVAVAEFNTYPEPVHHHERAV